MTGAFFALGCADEVPTEIGTPDPEWHWEQPLPQGNSLSEVDGRCPDDVYAIGANGTVLHFDGSEWKELAWFRGESLLDLWVDRGTGAAWIVTYKGLAARYEAGTWQRLDFGPEPASAVWGTAANHVLVAGKGAIHAFDGENWTSHPIPDGAYVTSLWGSSPDDVYATSGYGPVLHFDGDAWSTVFERSAFGSIRMVHGTSWDDVYLVTIRARDGLPSTGLLVHFDGSSWNEVLPEDDIGRPVHFMDLTGSSHDSLVGVTWYGELLRYDGRSWALEPTPAVSSDGPIFAVWPSPESHPI